MDSHEICLRQLLCDLYSVAYWAVNRWEVWMLGYEHRFQRTLTNIGPIFITEYRPL